MSKQIWEQFVERIASKALATGATFEDKKQWVVYTGASGHRIAIQKSRGKLPRIETTLDLAADQPEVVEEIRDNGRMRAVLLPTPSVVAVALELIADTSNPIPAPRRGGKQSQVADLDALLADVDPPRVAEATSEEREELAAL